MDYGKSLLVALVSCISLAGCGGGGGGSPTAGGPTGSTQSPVVAVGRITAFGSVFVNGVEYETNHTSYSVDGAPASDDSALWVGMVVRIRGSHDGHGHGIATEIRYNDEVDGPVANLAVDAADPTVKHFTVFGLTVIANATTVFKGEHGTSYTFDDLADGDHVEVSGDFDGDTLIATFIELESGSNFEAKGTVSGLNGSTFVLTLRNGSTLNVTLAAGASVPAGLMDGSFVEVKGTVPDAMLPQEFLAQRVQLEDDDDFDGEGHDEHERSADLCGVLAFDGTVWSVRGTELAFSSSTSYRPDSLAGAIADGSAAGLRVDVEGPIVDGVLQVERIRADGEADGTDELKLKGYVEGVTSDSASGTTTITMSFAPAEGTVDVLANADTLLMDDSHMAGVDLSALEPDVSFIHVRGHLDDTGAFIASALKVEDHPEEYEVEGPVDTDGFVADVSISVLGVKFMLDSGTFIEDGAPSSGDLVAVEDRDRDGFAESVERDDHHHEWSFARPRHDD